MNKFSAGLAVASLALCGVSASANAATNLTAGQYASTGTVANSSGANCSQVGLTQGAANNAILTYPGNGKSGLTLYVPGSGNLQLCTGFAAVPAGGLNGFSSSANCAVYTINGNIPASSVSFKFTAETANANSGVGTTTIAIPLTAPLGGGCTATVNTSLVRTGK